MKTYLLTFLLIVSLSANAQKQNLQLNLKKGSTYTRSMNSHTVVKQNINGRQIDIDVSMTMKMQFKVNDIVNDNYQMDILNEDVSVNLKMPDLIQNNTNGPDINSIVNKVAKSMVGKKYSIEMSKTGKVIKASNNDLVEGLFESFPNIDAATKQKMEASMKQLMGSKAFKDNMESMSAYLPEKPVAKGERWNVSTPGSSVANSNMTVTYTLEDVTDQYYVVTGNGNSTPNENGTPVNMNGMSMKQNLSGVFKTTMKINKATGWVVDGNVTSQMKGDITMGESEKTPNGMKILMETSSMMRFTE